ncbi:uncharacterized protein LOC100198219 isoform X1 [Hydra vulgaris]|uniref:uncharacterized protein LOC100198219 isoform X1 n=2 Tax=Hydra vulgaris TaxID=6087 RepID=UPI001F5F94C0|nr:4-coumarate--CoA ligase 2-like [Hydra vulgaris]
MYSFSKLRKLYVQSLSCQLSSYRTIENVLKCNERVVEPQEKNDLYGFLKNQFIKHAEKTALVDAITEQKISYNEILRNSASLSNFLKFRKINSTECVATHIQNCIEYIYLIMGCLKCRATITLANPAYTHFEINKQLKDSNAKILFTNKRQIEIARKAVENTNTDLVICVDDFTVNDCGVINLSDILQNFNNNQTITSTSEPYSPTSDCTLQNSKVNDIAFLLYSSGTTGLPKGTMLTHSNITVHLLQLLEAFEWNIQERILALLPFFHCYGLIVVLLKGLYYGSTLFVVPGFEPHLFLSTIEKFQIQRAPIVPPIALFLKSNPIVDDYNISSLQKVIVGAAPLDEVVASSLNKKFPNIGWQQGYGLTECSPVVCLQVNKTTQKSGSCGNVLPNTEVKIIDLVSGNNCGPNEKGEVWVRGPQVMKGYLNNPQATDECLMKDGWLRTGDLGYYDHDNTIFIVDRLKELIKFKGFQVAPAELEDILLGHPNVDDSCVIGIPDKISGELPRAYLVINDSSLSEEDVHNYVNERIADYKRLRGGIVFVSKLPKSPTGKLLRRVVKEEYLNSLPSQP